MRTNSSNPDPFKQAFHRKNKTDSGHDGGNEVQVDGYKKNLCAMSFAIGHSPGSP